LSKKATVPPGWVPDVAVTVAVSVGALGQMLDPPSLEDTVVTVLAGAMTWLSAGLLEDRSLTVVLVKVASRA
jgi:hypothetical protein